MNKMFDMRSRLRKMADMGASVRREDVCKARELYLNDKDLVGLIERFPVRELTKKKFGALPRGADIDIMSCPIGTLFVCTPAIPASGMKIVGKVVWGKDIFPDQWTKGVDLPIRGINRYRVRIVD